MAEGHLLLGEEPVPLLVSMASDMIIPQAPRLGPALSSVVTTSHMVLSAFNVAKLQEAYRH